MSLMVEFELVCVCLFIQIQTRRESHGGVTRALDAQGISDCVFTYLNTVYFYVWCVCGEGGMHA